MILTLFINNLGWIGFLSLLTAIAAVAIIED